MEKDGKSVIDLKSLPSLKGLENTKFLDSIVAIVCLNNYVNCHLRKLED
jgi:hypothetical protein